MMTTEGIISEFIVEQLAQHRQQGNTRPLVIGLQGPQGSGKSYLAGQLEKNLSHKLKLCFLSLDDLYLPYEQLRQLKVQHAANDLLDGRGLPGTHDMKLAQSTLEALVNINATPSTTVQLPIYDKSKHAGLGDRLAETRPVTGPLDVVVFEGWMLGFYPISTEALDQAYATSKPIYDRAVLSKSDPLGKSELRGPFFKKHSLEALKTVNDCLMNYVAAMWQYIDCFAQIVPDDMAFTYNWRLQQEHAMKAKNGGHGMSDEHVESFVSRYMPGYELFGAGVQDDRAPWKNRGKMIVIDQQRQALAQASF